MPHINGGCILKKSIIWFFVFLVCGLFLWGVCREVEGVYQTNYFFPLVIFVEVAAYGSLILYEVTKKNSKDKDKEEDKK